MNLYLEVESITQNVVLNEFSIHFYIPNQDKSNDNNLVSIKIDYKLALKIISSGFVKDIKCNEDFLDYYFKTNKS